ncbi:MAG: hemerythrin family protein [Deltaproteobacteria bacterium]|nr:hemerythrin family protein [Deltaproteobacteria bacterium]
MAGILWTESLATGVDWQDSQHKELFNRINALIDAMERHREIDELSNIFSFLDKYAKTHFKKEEAFMDTHGYSDTSSHKALHMTFLGNMTSIINEAGNCNSGDEIRRLVIKARRLLVDWLFEHIAKVDKKLGSFMLEKNRAQRVSAKG